jgi:hypothetical protein
LENALQFEERYIKKMEKTVSASEVGQLPKPSTVKETARICIALLLIPTFITFMILAWVYPDVGEVGMDVLCITTGFMSLFGGTSHGPAMCMHRMVSKR